MILHVDKSPINTNISQKSLTFSLEIFKSRSWYFSRNVLKDSLHIILIGTTTPFFVKELSQVYMKLIHTQRKTIVFIVEYSGRGLPPPKFVASVDL